MLETVHINISSGLIAGWRSSWRMAKNVELTDESLIYLQAHQACDHPNVPKLPRRERAGERSLIISHKFLMSSSDIWHKWIKTRRGVRRCWVIFCNSSSDISVTANPGFVWMLSNYYNVIRDRFYSNSSCMVDAMNVFWKKTCNRRNGEVLWMELFLWKESWVSALWNSQEVLRLRSSWLTWQAAFFKERERERERLVREQQERTCFTT